jgi:hypothetical protein
VTKDDGDGFEAGMIALAAVTGKELDTIIKRAYWVALEDVPGDVVAEALRLAMNNCDYFPSAAELRRLCDEADDDSFELTPPAPVALLEQGAIVPTYEGAVPNEPEPTYYCYHCKDTSFQHFICQDGDRCNVFELCIELVAAHGAAAPAHTWIRKCSCIHSNPAIQKRLTRLRDAVSVGKYAGRPRKRLHPHYGGD